MEVAPISAQMTLALTFATAEMDMTFQLTSVDVMVNPCTRSLT